MKKSKIIMMCGVCGSGKSTYSKKIEKEEGYIRLSIDEMLYNKFGLQDIDFPKEKYQEYLKIIDNELRLELIKLIQQNENVIIDSSFWSKFKRDSYKELLNNNGVDNDSIQLIYLKCDYQTLHSRLQLRNQSINANSPFIITDEILKHHYYGFEEPINENEIIILQK